MASAHFLYPIIKYECIIQYIFIVILIISISFYKCKFIYVLKWNTIKIFNWS